MQTRPFIYSGDGSAEFSNGLIRENYKWHHSRFYGLADLKATLRACAYTSIGCYPLYLITADGAALSFTSVRENWREVCSAMLANDRNSGWYIMACDVNYEDPSLYCEHSGERIPSAYAEDRSDD